MTRTNDEIITFKAPAELVEALRDVPNRSEFIRSALTAAMRKTCPLCRGAGTLSPRQLTHWEEFARSHSIVECDDCHELHLQCSAPTRRKSR